MSARGLMSISKIHFPETLILCLSLTWSVQVLAQTSPSDFTYGTRYDLMGRVTGTIAPDPDVAGPLHYLAVRNKYDAAGRLIKVESGELASWISESTVPDLWTNFTVYKTVEMTYNAQSQKLLEVVKGSDLIATAAIQYSYDNFGRLECAAVRMNPNVYTTLPASACTIWTEGSFGKDRITKNIYNARGDLVKVQKAVGDTALIQDYATYTYWPNGTRKTVTDARGYMASMEYDGVDRQSKWIFPCPTELAKSSPCASSPPCPPNCQPPSDYEQYSYDPNGNRTSLRKRDGFTFTYAYDALNRMTTKIVPERAGLDPTHTRDVYYGYDSFSRMTSARFDSTSGEGVATGYDGFSEVTSSNISLSGLSASLSFQFDADGNRKRVTYGDANYVTYDYDGLDRSTYVKRSGNATLALTAYNPRGSRLSLTGGFSTSYDYWPDGRLKYLTNTPIYSSLNNQYSFSYNPASQMTQLSRSNDAFAWTGAVNSTESYSPNGLNQYTSAIGAAQTYDANGNLTSDGSTTYVYDVENRLVSASGAKNATLKYDPMGRLVETTGESEGLTRFVYDGDALVQELNGGGGLRRRYVHGTDAGDDPIVWFEGGGFSDTEQRLLRSDHQGSIVAVGDATSTNIWAVNTFDEYGKQGTGNQGRFQYTGQTWMSELGLYYYKARMYSPKLGRFMQTDPIGYNDDLNLYSYVGGDPVIARDPTGLCTGTAFCWQGSGAAGGAQGVKSTGEYLAQSPVAKAFEGGRQAANNVAKTVDENTGLSVSANAGANAIVGIDASVKVDGQTFADNTVGVTGKFGQTGKVSLGGGIAANLRLGPSDIGSPKGSVALKDIFGAELAFGSKGMNLNLSIGAQAELKLSVPKLPSASVSGTRRVDATSFIIRMQDAYAE